MMAVLRLVCKDRGKPTPTEIAKFNRQYKGLTVTYSDDFHDRFVLIDNAELHNFAMSDCLGTVRLSDVAKALGTSVTTISKRRASLLAKGMIYSPAYGEIAFTVPMFAEFLRRNPEAGSNSTTLTPSLGPDPLEVREL